MNGTPPLLEEHRPVPAKIPPWRELLLFLLNIFLWFFFADAVLSVADDAAALVSPERATAAPRLIIGIFTILLGLLVYALMALTPAIPKKFFLPLKLFFPATQIACIPTFFYFYHHLPFVALVLSLIQMVFAVMMLAWIGRGRKIQFAALTDGQLGARLFSWKNSVVFVLLNGIFFLLVITGIAASVAWTIEHFSEGFMKLRPSGMSVRVSTYERGDGKKVTLYPMGHVADAAFYRKLSQDFPSNSVVLMEGVTDEKNLLTNGISYARMARKLGLSEQHQEFKPVGRLVRADVDVSEFSSDTIAVLNLVMLIHAKGLSWERLQPVMNYVQPDNLENMLFDDLLHKRNRHLLSELQRRLTDDAIFVIPWGAAHMPEIAHEVQKLGFRQTATEDVMIVRFRSKNSVAPASPSASKPTVTNQ